MKKQTKVTSKTKNVLDTNTLNKLASQLSCPTGKEGITMGNLLDETNKGMIEESINSLELEHKNRVLELGHGNCNHLKGLLQKAGDLRFFGMEISEVMREEAEKINKSFVKKRKALFQLYDGYTIPYVINFFDRILTINTIYFLENPLLFFNEIYRVLKPEGKFVIAFANKKFMETLPFVSNTTFFRLYDEESIIKLIQKTDFILDTIEVKRENVKSKIGEFVEREYLIVTLRKKVKKEQGIEN